MCPKHPQYVPGNAAASRPVSAGLHGPDGDQGSIVFRRERRWKEREMWVRDDVFFWLDE